MIDRNQLKEMMMRMMMMIEMMMMMMIIMIEMIPSSVPPQYSITGLK